MALALRVIRPKSDGSPPARTYTVTGETVFTSGSTLDSLDAMASALGAGDKVTVAGQATKDVSGAWVVSELTANTNGG